MTTTPSNCTNPTFLTQALINAVQSAYDKSKQSDSYKVHKVLINKLDDLATDLRTSTSTSPEGKGRSRGRSGGWWQGSNTVFTNNQPVVDLGMFVKCIVGSGQAGASNAGGVGGGWHSRDGASSLRYLWTGRPEEVGRKRREKEVVDEGEYAYTNDGVGTDGKEERGDGEKDGKDGKEGRMSFDREVKSSEDEGDLGFVNRPWSGRMQRKIEVWTAYVFPSHVYTAFVPVRLTSGLRVTLDSDARRNSAPISART